MRTISKWETTKHPGVLLIFNLNYNFIKYPPFDFIPLPFSIKLSALPSYSELGFTI
jgi:hypothetical protein